MSISITPIDKKKQLVPALRFKEFDEAWNKRKIREVLTIGSGKDYKHLESGEIPVYGTGGLMAKVNTPIYSGKSVFIGRKGSIDKPFYYDGDFWTVDTLFYTHSFQESIPYFVYGLFQKINWYKHNEASGVPSLSKTTIGNLVVNLPPLPEQQKIAAFLSAVDTKIQQLTQKKALLAQYKKGLMQQLFRSAGSGQVSRALRFKDDDGNEYPDWEEKKVGDFLVESRIKGDSGDIAKKLTVKLWGRGVFAKDDVTAGSAQTQYFIRKSGQFIYSKLDFLNCAFGIIPAELDCLQSTVDLPCFDFEDEIHPYYILEKVKQRKFYKQLGNRADGSRKAKRIHSETFRSFPIDVPCKSEQQKISSYLISIDTKIESVSLQITQTQTFKKGLLQQMFV